MKSLFTQPDAWTGGTIDALMYFPHAKLDQAVGIAKALWSCDRLDGPYRNRQAKPEAQERADYSGFTSDGCEQLFGAIRYDDGRYSIFIHTTILDENGLWVYAGPTIGSLPTNWQVGAFPFDEGNPTPWLEPLISRLRAIADHVHATFPIRAAMFGWLDVPDLDIVLSVVDGQIPDDRWAGISIWSGDTQTYYPPTHNEPPVKIA